MNIYEAYKIYLKDHHKNEDMVKSAYETEDDDPYYYFVPLGADDWMTRWKINKETGEVTDAAYVNEAEGHPELVGPPPAPLKDLNGNYIYRSFEEINEQEFPEWLNEIKEWFKSKGKEYSYDAL